MRSKKDITSGRMNMTLGKTATTIMNLLFKVGTLINASNVARK